MHHLVPAIRVPLVVTYTEVGHGSSAVGDREPMKPFHRPLSSSPPSRLHQMLQRFGYCENSSCSDAQDTAATTKLVTTSGESSKNYASWDDALKEAEDLKLINQIEATAAKALPAGFPLHTTTEMDAGNLAKAGFTPGETSLPRWRVWGLTSPQTFGRCRNARASRNTSDVFRIPHARCDPDAGARRSSR